MSRRKQNRAAKTDSWVRPILVKVNHAMRHSNRASTIYKGVMEDVRQSMGNPKEVLLNSLKPFGLETGYFGGVEASSGLNFRERGQDFLFHRWVGRIIRTT